MSILDLLGDLPAGAGTDDPIENAAYKLRDAVRDFPGRRRAIKSWKKLVGPWLGKKRLAQPVYQAVIDKAVELQLLQVDNDSGAYPFLVVLNPDKQPEPPKPEKTPKAPEPVEKDKPPSKGMKGSGPVHMDCGHFSWWSPDKTPENCRQCARGVSGPPLFRKGKYAELPVGKGDRRSVERQARPGWKGFCSDPKTHIYIGGPRNDCRKLLDGSPRDTGFCVVHEPKNTR